MRRFDRAGSDVESPLDVLVVAHLLAVAAIILLERFGLFLDNPTDASVTINRCDDRLDPSGKQQRLVFGKPSLALLVVGDCQAGELSEMLTGMIEVQDLRRLRILPGNPLVHPRCAIADEHQALAKCGVLVESQTELLGKLLGTPEMRRVFGMENLPATPHRC